MNGKYGGPDLPRSRTGGVTGELLSRIDSPGKAVYVMSRAINSGADDETLLNLARLIRTGKTQMAPGYKR